MMFVQPWVAKALLLTVLVMTTTASRGAEVCCEASGDFEAQIAGTIMTIPANVSQKQCAPPEVIDPKRTACRDALERTWNAVIDKPMDHFCKAACASQTKPAKSAQTTALIRLVRARVTGGSAVEVKECLIIFYCACKGGAVDKTTENLDRQIRLTGDTRCMQIAR
jgi:hypothetical protein